MKTFKDVLNEAKPNLEFPDEKAEAAENLCYGMKATGNNLFKKIEKIRKDSKNVNELDKVISELKEKIKIINSLWKNLKRLK